MPEEKIKTVKVKLATNAVLGGKVHKKDAVVDATEAEAKTLINNKHAELHSEKPAPQQQIQQRPVPSKADLAKRFAEATKTDLANAIVSAKEVSADSPDYNIAQAVIAYCEELLKK